MQAVHSASYCRGQLGPTFDESEILFPFNRSFFFQGLLQVVQAKILSETKIPSASTAAFLWLLAIKVGGGGVWEGCWVC